MRQRWTGKRGERSEKALSCSMWLFGDDRREAARRSFFWWFSNEHVDSTMIPTTEYQPGTWRLASMGRLVRKVDFRPRSRLFFAVTFISKTRYLIYVTSRDLSCPRRMGCCAGRESL